MPRLAFCVHRSKLLYHEQLLPPHSTWFCRPDHRFLYVAIPRAEKISGIDIIFPQGEKKRIFTRSLLLLVAWSIITSILSITGFLSDFNTLPPRLFFVLLVPLITLIVLMNVKATGEILQHAPPHVIIRLQVFRVFVELLLWALFAQNLLPVQMTFEGRNFDILVGLTAPVIALAVSASENLERRGCRLESCWACHFTEHRNNCYSLNADTLSCLHE